MIAEVLNGKLAGMLAWVMVAVGFPSWSAELPEVFMPSAQVRPGMSAEGRTVFRGYEVERFPMEILGVERNARPGSNMILARVLDDRFEKHGIAAGMSGSPVYIDGKIIGAIAYGWSFSYQPICGITPIEDMWTVWESIGRPGLTEAAGRWTAEADPEKAPWDWSKAWEAYQGQPSSDPPRSENRRAGFRPTLPELEGLEGRLIPLGTPLFVSASSGRTLERVSAFFESRGFDVMGASTLAATLEGSAERAPEIEAGSALGVPLLRGDLVIGGVGTATYRRGDKVLGFGHPMFGLGGTSAPLAPAYIFGIMHSYQRSFKLGALGEPVGVIDQDRLFAIGGRFGRQARRIPIQVRVDGPAVSRPRDYGFSAWRHPDFLPTICVAAVEEAFAGSVATQGRLNAETDYRIRLGNGRVVEKHFATSSDRFVIAHATSRFMFDLFMLAQNPFREASIESIEMDVRVHPGLLEDQLISLRSDHAVYEPGEVVGLKARLHRWRGEEYEWTCEVPLPAHLRPGGYVIHLADAEGALRVERFARPGRFAPRDFDGVLRVIEAMGFSDDRLRVYLFEPAMGMDIDSAALGSLPDSVAGVLKETVPRQRMHPSVGRQLYAGVHSMSAPVFGSRSLVIQVKQHVTR